MEWERGSRSGTNGSISSRTPLASNVAADPVWDQEEVSASEVVE
jgi:hypothetical protein